VRGRGVLRPRSRRGTRVRQRGVASGDTDGAAPIETQPV
jgi:hypothetical protein